ncbi:hypothetical protein EVAR_55213_1 [Eumeta japonica]|uniref:Uncharacterized protein n=1 Tax=Eumeta variegata TaxID=151549 RepID=A0A4C1ZSF1_EUMVA|nr:hypothetical protein EVAR_55213_1 [Eumeta japonica]
MFISRLPNSIWRSLRGGARPDERSRGLPRTLSPYEDFTSTNVADTRARDEGFPGIRDESACVNNFRGFAASAHRQGGSVTRFTSFVSRHAFTSLNFERNSTRIVLGLGFDTPEEAHVGPHKAAGGRTDG